MTLYGNYYLKSISQNPFRILGVTSNAPKKEITANVNKFKAFIRVGKNVEGNFDLIKGTNKVIRTVESIETAEKAIELPIDRLRWSLFWFVNNGSIDQIALNHVRAGKIERAIEIWEKVGTVSSLINLVVSELTQQNWIDAVLYVDRLFSKYASDVSSLVDETLNLSSHQLMRLFMDTIASDNNDVLKLMYNAFPQCCNFDELVQDGECNFLSTQQKTDQTSGIHYPCLEVKKNGSIAYYVFQEHDDLDESQFNEVKGSLLFITSSNDSRYKFQTIYNQADVEIPSKQWNTCIRETLAKPYVENAKVQIAKCKAIPKDDIVNRYKFAKNILLTSLVEIYGYLGAGSSEYQTLNNQIVKESLQCAIDYYNKSQYPEAVAQEVKNFLWLITTSAAPNSALRQRCKENYDTLCEICSKLPPDSVAYYHRLLNDVIKEYQEEDATIQNASAFVRRCFPYLMSIKTVLGTANAYYQKMCTRIAEDALGDIITDYNNKSESLHNRLENATSNNRSNIIKLIQDLMRSAVVTMYHLSKLELEDNFYKNRFKPNYGVIVKQARIARVFGTNGVSAILGGEISVEDFNNDLKKHNPDQRDEDGYFSTIKNLKDCREYKRIFPKGKFAKQVNSKIEEYLYQECSTLEDLEAFKKQYPLSKFDLEKKREEIIFKSCKTIDDYQAYLSKYSTFRDQAISRIDDLRFEQCRNRNDYAIYLNSYPNGNYRLEAQRKLDELDYGACKTLQDFERYLQNYPNGFHSSDARKRIADETAWRECVKRNSWKAYKEYLSKFPYGRHSSEAKPKAVSPSERFKKWRENNGCLFTLLIIAAVVLLIAGIANGVLGIGYIFGAVAVCGVFGSIGNEDIGCGTRIAVLGVGLIAGLIAVGLISWGEELERENKVEKAISSLPSNPSVSDYQKLFSQYGNHMDNSQKQELLEQYYSASLDSCYSTISDYSSGEYISTLSGLGYIQKFAEICHDPSYRDKSEARYSELVDSLYTEANTLNTYDGWIAYQSSVPSDDFRDSQEKKDASDTRWSTDNAAWQTASSIGNIASYQKYLELYPYGKHKSAAESKLIDLQVDATFAGEHGYLPEMDKTSYGGGSTSTISVYNNTSYTLTLLYSGKESKKLVLSPNSRGSLRLKNGSYRIAASVSASNVQRYAGSETLSGGGYEVEYYISTTTIPSYRRY